MIAIHTAIIVAMEAQVLDLPFFPFVLHSAKNL